MVIHIFIHMLIHISIHMVIHMNIDVFRHSNEGVKVCSYIYLTQLQHLIGVKWLFGRLDSFFMGVVGTTDFIDPVAGMSR